MIPSSHWVYHAAYNMTNMKFHWAKYTKIFNNQEIRFLSIATNFKFTSKYSYKDYKGTPTLYVSGTLETNGILNRHTIAIHIFQYELPVMKE